METAQTIIILFLLGGIISLYLDNKNIKFWRDYYQKETYDFQEERDDYLNLIGKKEKHNHQLSEMCFRLEEKLNKAEEIISQQKQELTKKNI